MPIYEKPLRAKQHVSGSPVLEGLGWHSKPQIFVLTQEIKARNQKVQPSPKRCPGKNPFVLTWGNKCRGGKEPRSGALMRMLGVFETASG